MQGHQERREPGLGKAAEQAQTSYANEAAIVYYGRLLPLLDGAERVDEAVKFAEVLQLIGDIPRAEAVVLEARALAAKEAHARALAAGALEPQVVFSQEDNQVNNDIDGNVFFEATVTATAWGQPLRKVLQR